jgi:hypothetical protein
VPADDYLDSTFVLFVGGFVAALFGFAAAVVYVTTGDVVPEALGIVSALAALGGVFFLAALGVAGYLKMRE